MKKNCFARMRSLFKASSGSDAPVVGASSSEKSLLRFKRLFFKPIDYESRATTLSDGSPPVMLKWWIYLTCRSRLVICRREISTASAFPRIQ